jgi:hypothetical protein
MQYEAGARMILDAVLLTISDISLDAQGGLPVAIFPQMQIAPVLVKNFETQFEVRLSGNVDYAVCTYESEAHRGTMFGTGPCHLVLTIFSSYGATISP